MPFYRAIECGLLFGALPVSLALLWRKFNPIPLLIFTATVVLAVLLRDPTFNPACLIRLPDLAHNLLMILLPLPVLAALLAALLYRLAPAQLFKLPRRKPRVWAMVMLAYPLISVVPQTIIYRVYFMHRYEMLFGSGWGMILAATLAFGLGHVIFRHPVPVVVTMIGGLIFAIRYHVTGSAPLSAFEHALYGDLAFTIGYGYYLYHGSVRSVEAMSGNG